MTEVRIFGEIGRDVTAKAVAEQLDGVTDDVIVRVNSGGGDVYEGIAIMNQLRACPGHVTVVIESLAASAASFIAVGGGDTVISRPNAEVMIHKAWTMNVGNADDMQRAIGDLQRQDVKLAGIYAAKAGGEVDEWLDRMSAETWYTAEEALQSGLVDAIEDARRPVEPVAASSIRARYSCRAAAPPPPVTRSESGDKTTMPSDGRKEEQNMTLLNELAQTLGKSEDQVLAALGRIMNEEVTVNVTVELSYEPAEIVPTDKVVLQPVGDIPPGLVFAAGEAPEGWGVEVAEDTGVVTVTAPAGAEPGDEVTIPVLVTGDGVEVELSAQVTVKAAAPEESESEGESPAKSAPAGPETVTLDMDTYNWLKDAAARGAEAKAKADEADMRAEVDGWVKEGRLHPQNREKAFEDLKARGDAARVLYSSIPENTFPVREIGHSRDDEVNENKISGAANPFASVRY